ncbi:MAG: uroporphyrinogen-III C-methyltransferase [Vicinamibacterales bacterium]|jgi:uroporphyrin-III C-methyltransferase/precorrin-2 dehydrogenase/sirohydrochlorin ferrochelatase|nr:uroporphyrinogen-III C-methyltransferase [Vicinamibacterales bacterium]
MKVGFVSLVGAGPGDPDLLTVQALDRLRAADLVLFDALVTPDVVALATRAQRFSVAKRAGRKSVRQETITRVMIRAARRGSRVVRLKCGDPYVLGRGGEEALALRAHGIPFEVVQGVTTAVAAPALAGIPVTHRGLSSGFVVVSGHDEASYRPVLGSLAPSTLTVVVLMGLAHRDAIATCLIDRGWPIGTTVAVVFAASTPHTRTWVGTLGDLGTAPEATDANDPGTIVIGNVVDLHAQLAACPDRAPSAVVEGKG